MYLRLKSKSKPPETKPIKQWLMFESLEVMLQITYQNDSKLMNFMQKEHYAIKLKNITIK